MASTTFKQVEMEGLHYVIKPSRNCHPDISALIESILVLIYAEQAIWEAKPATKTMTRIIRCKSTLEITNAFVKDDNLKAAYLTLSGHSGLVQDLKGCFYRKKEKANEALRGYRQFMQSMIKWTEK